MRSLTFDTANAGVPAKELQRISQTLKPAITAMKAALSKGYDDDRASINLPSDKQMLKEVLSLAKKYKKVDTLVVIGIGGSNLGTIAVKDAILGKLSNEFGTKVYFADTVDPSNIGDILKLLKKNVLVNIVTKSGSTTETIANAEVFIKAIKKKKNIVVTTDEGSKLWYLASQLGIDTLPIPKKVGGRYSVFSAVGLFPLAILGVNVKRLLKGAEEMVKTCSQSDIRKNPAALSAAIQYYNSLHGKTIHDTFIFSTDFENMGKWYRQLEAESCGKERDLNGNVVHAGITPTASVGTVDLHSIAQLHLGGPKDKLTTFVTLERERGKVKIPKLKLGFTDLVAGIEGKTYKQVRDAIFSGVTEAYKKRKLPFMHVSLGDAHEDSVGQFLQFKMMEIMYLGHLLNVNPFNQPNVEEYKDVTRKILKK